jgi:hypothetical protein
MSWWLGGAALLPLLYVLSIGPATALNVAPGGVCHTVLIAIYAPLDWLDEHTPISGPLRWYVRLWD